MICTWFTGSLGKLYPSSLYQIPELIPAYLSYKTSTVAASYVSIITIIYMSTSLCLAEVNEKLKEIREDIQKLTEVMGEVRQKEIFKVNFTLDYIYNAFHV